jgi:hypothetical protein
MRTGRRRGRACSALSGSTHQSFCAIPTPGVSAPASFFSSFELFAWHVKSTTPQPTMVAVKRKAEAAGSLSKKDKSTSSDRHAKRRKSDATEQPSPANAKPERTAPKSVFKDEEKAFPRGGASVLTPLEHKQIQIQANQDVLFEAAGGKRSGGDNEFGDMGSEDEERAAPKSSKKRPSKKGNKAHQAGEEEPIVRVEGLSYKVSQSIQTNTTLPY